MARFEFNQAAIKADPRVQKAVLDIGKAIADQANRNTDAPIQIEAHLTREGLVRIGPRGAAAIVVEFGGAKHIPRRPVKRALDKFRI